MNARFLAPVLAAALVVAAPGRSMAQCSTVDSGSFTLVIDGAGSFYDEKAVILALTNPSQNGFGASYEVTVVELGNEQVQQSCALVTKHPTRDRCTDLVFGIQPGQTDRIYVEPLQQGAHVRVEIKYAGSRLELPLLLEASWLQGGFGNPITSTSHEFVPRDQCR